MLSEKDYYVIKNRDEKVYRTSENNKYLVEFLKSIDVELGVCLVERE